MEENEDGSPQQKEEGKVNQKIISKFFGRWPQNIANKAVSVAKQWEEREPTPTSVANLKRSKRKTVVNDCFKSTSPAVTRSKAAVMKKVVVSMSDKHSSLPIPQTEFPNLAIIDKYINDALAHPHIPIFEL
jgi:hypothetical protein